MSNFLLWLVTVAHTLGCIGGAAFLVLAVSGWIPLGKTEHRCQRCQSYPQCHENSGGFPGVAYPCRDYVPKLAHCWKKDKP